MEQIVNFRPAIAFVAVVIGVRNANEIPVIYADRGSRYWREPCQNLSIDLSLLTDLAGRTVG